MSDTRASNDIASVNVAPADSAAAPLAKSEWTAPDLDVVSVVDVTQAAFIFPTDDGFGPGSGDLVS